MGRFLGWNEWRALRESNARKRAVIAALNGTGPELPGSYAASPMTIPAAMDVAQETGVVGKYKRRRKSRRKKRRHMQNESKNTEKKPDYSFDQWLKKIQQLGDQVSELIEKGKKEDGEIENKKKKQKDEEKSQDKKPPISKNKLSNQDSKKSDEKSFDVDRKDIKKKTKVKF
jgi:hypothetical protein